jgi:regulator of RNase E activity RraA
MDRQDLTIFDNFYTGLLSDVLQFDLDYYEYWLGIFPTAGYTGIPIHGFAFGCEGRYVYRSEDVDDNIRMEMWEAMPINCIQVIGSRTDSMNASGYPFPQKKVAKFGDISARLSKNAGAKGTIVDGLIRDADLIDTLHYPVFAHGTCPYDAYGNWQIQNFGVDVSVNNITITNGFYLFADRDGVIGFEPELIPEVIEHSKKRLYNENIIREKLKPSLGAPPMTATQLAEEFERW